MESLRKLQKWKLFVTWVQKIWQIYMSCCIALALDWGLDFQKWRGEAKQFSEVSAHVVHWEGGL